MPRSARPTLAVLGGSFDPPHLGHALIPTWLFARNLAARVVAAPVWEHPFGKTMAAFEQRVAWLRLAMASHGDKVVVSELERELALAHGGPSTSLRLLDALARAYPQMCVRLVIGSDIDADARKRWHAWDEIAKRFAPIVVPRSGYTPDDLGVLPAISSSEVRAWLARPADVDAQSRLERAVPADVLALLRAPSRGRIWVVGLGHVGTHLLRWLPTLGFEVTGMSARAVVGGGQSVPAALPTGVWLACRDAAIVDVAAAVHASLPIDVPMVHAAGALRSDDVRALAAPQIAGRPVGTLHPICSLRRECDDVTLRDAAFGFEGDDAARDLARMLVGTQMLVDLGGLDASNRIAYHAACSLVANHLAVLAGTGVEVWAGLGLARDAAHTALMALLVSALHNLHRLGIPHGVTGPVARGDQETVARHIEALQRSSPDGEAGELYRSLSERLAQLLASTRDPPPIRE